MQIKELRTSLASNAMPFDKVSSSSVGLGEDWMLDELLLLEEVSDGCSLLDEED
jgi:hypothetical protein